MSTPHATVPYYWQTDVLNKSREKHSSKIGVVHVVYVHKQKIKMEPSVCLCTAYCIYNRLLPKE